MKFYKIDDQIVISDKSMPVGTELVANTTDASNEKHVPVIAVSGEDVTVTVGSVEHPQPSRPLHRVDRADDTGGLPDSLSEAGPDACRGLQNHRAGCGGV